MVIHNLNIGGAAFRPAKADAPSLIHPNALLSLAAAFEGFEPVARRHAQVSEFRRGVNHDELAVHDALEVLRQPAGDEAPVKLFCFGVGETLNQAELITQDVIKVKPYACSFRISPARKPRSSR